MGVVSSADAALVLNLGGANLSVTANFLRTTQTERSWVNFDAALRCFLFFIDLSGPTGDKRVSGELLKWMLIVLHRSLIHSSVQYPHVLISTQNGDN